MKRTCAGHWTSSFTPDARTACPLPIRWCWRNATAIQPETCPPAIRPSISSSISTVTDPIETNPPRVDTPPQTDVTPPETTPPSEPETPLEEEKKPIVKIVRGSWYIRTGAGKSYKSVGVAHEGDVFDYLGKSGSWNAVSYNGNKRWIYNSGSKVEGFSKGGWIEDVKNIARRQGDDVVTVNTLKRGEAVLELNIAKSFVKFAGNIPQIVHTIGNYEQMAAIDKMRAAPNYTNQAVQNEFNYEINIPIDHVEDYDDLIYKITHDRKFEGLIQDMTINRLAGGSKFEKYRTRFWLYGGWIVSISLLLNGGIEREKHGAKSADRRTIQVGDGTSRSMQETIERNHGAEQNV